MGKSLTKTVSIAIWKNLDSETKWRIIKIGTPIITALLVKKITNTVQKIVIPGVLIAGTVIALMVFSKK